MIARKHSLFLLLVSLVFAFVAVGVKPVEAPLLPHEYTLDLNVYVPCKITFNYPYTHNHSVRDISTIGASLYKHSGGPRYLEFLAEDIDTYRFTVELRYSTPKNDTIVMGLWSGTTPMDGQTFASYFENVVFRVKLNVMKEPSYPTDIEVAEAVTMQIAKDLAEQQMANEALMQKLEVATTTNSILSLVTVGSVIAIMIVVFTELRRIRRGQVNV